MARQEWENHSFFCYKKYLRKFAKMVDKVEKPMLKYECRMKKLLKRRKK
jgi:hypothetical protein